MKTIIALAVLLTICGMAFADTVCNPDGFGGFRCRETGISNNFYS